MCFYYSLSKLAQRYQERAENNEILRKMNLVNGFKFPVMPVVTESGLELKKWGLIPFWSKEEKIREYTLNARNDTIFEKPSFKNNVMTHRCIIPATGYIDWQHNGKVKQPFYIHLKNQEAFSFAGIWDDWKNPETGQTVSTYSIVTTDANPLLAEIHNTKKRQPVILTEDIEFSWLEKGLTKTDIESYFVPLGEEHYDAYPIQSFNMTDEDTVFERLNALF